MVQSYTGVSLTGAKVVKGPTTPTPLWKPGYMLPGGSYGGVSGNTSINLPSSTSTLPRISTPAPSVALAAPTKMNFSATPEQQAHAYDIPAPPITNATPVTPQNTAIDDYFKKAGDAVTQQQQQISGLRDIITNQADPYSMGNPGMQAQRALAQNQINSGYKTAQQQLREHLAQRGMLGTAQEDAALSGMSVNQGRDISQAGTQLAADSYDKQQGFENNRINSLTNLAGMSQAGAYTGLASALLGQSAQNFDQSYKTNRAAVSDSQFNTTTNLDQQRINATLQQIQNARTDADRQQGIATLTSLITGVVKLAPLLG